MSFDTLESLYKFLEPSSQGGTSSGTADTKPKSLEDMISEMILSTNGEFVTSEKMFKELSNHFTTRNTTEAEKKEASIKFQIITSKSEIQKTIKLGDYFDKDTSGLATSDVLSIIDIARDTPQFDITVFTTRGNFVSPSTRGTKNIDLFLNYMPPLVSAQLVPYLDVEFKIVGASRKFLNTPSQLRFLMGSKQLKDNLSGADAVMRDSSLFESEKESDSRYSSVGMELFLMPQTLTNMEGLGPSSDRLVRAKPFLPFASIESLDVAVANAGAGKFSHKTGNLKLKIHDKGRISEFSEFIRGASGINETIIWTTYGWLAPRNRGDADKYSEFINDNMLMRESWKIVNSQFSFDASGQVSVNLQLVSQAAKHLREISVSETVEAAKDFHAIIKAVNEVKQELTSRENPFAISLESEQILNAGSTNGVFPDFQGAKAAIPNLIASLKNTGLTQDDLKKLEENLNKLTGGTYSYDQVKLSIGAEVKRKFEGLSFGTDPYLPREGSQYFDSDVVKTITTFNSSKEYTRRAEALKKLQDDNAKTRPISINIDKKSVQVVSFGKLFLSFLLSSYAVSSFPKCNDLQIFFYGLNDQCGPISNHSIAEFPIDVTAVAYAYAEHIKTNNVETLDLQTFLKLVIESQFSDQRAIGYGMNSFFNAGDSNDKEKTQLIKDPTVEAGYAKWLSTYGGFKPPVIEMFVETGEAGSASKRVIDNLKGGIIAQEAAGLDTTKTIVKRIHIYDKQSNPHRLAQMIIDAGDNYEIGEINREKLRGEIMDVLRGKSEAQLAALKRGLSPVDPKAPDSVKKEAEAAGTITTKLRNVVVVDKPEGPTVKIGKDRESIRASLMRMVPTIAIGTNGTLVTAVNVASKTDGTMGAINIMNAAKGQAKGKPTVSDNGLEGIGGLPLRSVPVQLTMSSLGVPNAQLYQTFFIDFNTGTTLDNIYNCTQIQHNITPGKFITNWTFMPSDKGYGKFSAPPSVDSAISKQLLEAINSKISEMDKEKKKKAAETEPR